MDNIKRSKTPTKIRHNRSQTAISPGKVGNKKSVNQPDKNMKMMLEMIQSLRKEDKQNRNKLELANGIIQKQKQQILKLKTENSLITKDNQSITKKYKKIKLKYYQGKKSEQISQVPIIPLNQNKINQNVQEDVAALQQQIVHKNLIIQKLSLGVNQCEQYTVDIVKVVNVLEQKVQELTMDNSLLRGLIHQQQSRNHTQQNCPSNQ